MEQITEFDCQEPGRCLLKTKSGDQALITETTLHITIGNHANEFPFDRYWSWVEYLGGRIYFCTRLKQTAQHEEGPNMKEAFGNTTWPLGQAIIEQMNALLHRPPDHIPQVVR